MLPSVVSGQHLPGPLRRQCRGPRHGSSRPRDERAAPRACRRDQAPSIRSGRFVGKTHAEHVERDHGEPLRQCRPDRCPVPRIERIAVDRQQSRPTALEAIEDVEPQVVEVLPTGFPVFEFGVHPTPLSPRFGVGVSFAAWDPVPARPSWRAHRRPCDPWRSTSRCPRAEARCTPRVANPGGVVLQRRPTGWSALGSHRAGRLTHHPGHQRRVA